MGVIRSEIKECSERAEEVNNALDNNSGLPDSLASRLYHAHRRQLDPLAVGAGVGGFRDQPGHRTQRCMKEEEQCLSYSISLDS
jgi:hypothetical protein